MFYFDDFAQIGTQLKQQVKVFSVYKLQSHIFISLFSVNIAEVSGMHHRGGTKEG